MIRYKTYITYLIAFLLAIGSILRYLGYILQLPYREVIIGLIAVFFLLMALEPWLSRRSKYYIHLYLITQTCILLSVTLLTRIEDIFSIPFLSLTLQVMNSLPPRIGIRWIIIFSAITIVFVPIYGYQAHGIGLSETLPNVLIYVAVYFLTGGFYAVIHQAETAKVESQQLLAELQTAHEQLQIYTTQAEELAIIEERNRLARNLHDSVTQTIFSMTLDSEAARLLIERDPSKAVLQLDKLQVLAKSALKEMRTLILEMRPTATAKFGLIPALRYHLTVLERQNGLKVTLNVSGEPQLSERQAHGLFRIIQEALNNVIKHARVDNAVVKITEQRSRVIVSIEDKGKGFIPDKLKKDDTHMGLSGMRERVENMGGILRIESNPGQGTRVIVEVTTTHGGEKNG